MAETDTQLVIDASPPPRLLDSLPPVLAEPLQRLRQSPLASRAMLPALLVTVLALVLIFWLVLTPTSRAPLYRQLPDADKAAVVSALQGAGLDVALDDTTGDVMLPRADHARARMLLASQGLPNAAPGGLDLLTDVPLGTSRAIEGARLKYAEERELARSIESLQGVESARVLIARPQATPFVREQAPVKASVTLTLASGRSLSDVQARAILHLVASAVPGLSTDNVAIVDQAGRLLAGEPGAGRLGGDGERLRMQAEMEARARQAILQFLGPVVGPDNVTAEVSIDLDFAAREAAQERFDPQSALRSEQYDRHLASAEPERAIGIPGAVSNTVPAAASITAEPQAENAADAEAADAPAPKIVADAATRNYELSRSVEVTSHSGGHVRRLTAAVAVRADALGPAQDRARVLAELQALVEGAIGFDATRGDKVTVSAQNFQTALVVDTPFWKEPVLVESAKWIAAGLVAVALIFLAFRPLLKRLGLAAEEAAAVPAMPPIAIADGGEAAFLPIDYTAKLAEARLLAATDTARATAVARRLLEAPEPQP